MSQVETEYCHEIESYWVRLPHHVSLNALEIWGSRFTLQLQKQSAPAGLLLDTNTHDFESVHCLKWLRQFFSESAAVRSGINRVAFVQPAQCRMPEVVTDSEAYFMTVEEAYKWLMFK
jgi:hypothetical protein